MNELRFMGKLTNTFHSELIVGALYNEIIPIPQDIYLHKHTKYSMNDLLLISHETPIYDMEHPCMITDFPLSQISPQIKRFQISSLTHIYNKNKV